MYMGCNALWLISTVHLKTKTKTKTKTNFLKDPTYDIFLKNRGLKDNKCDNLTGQPVNFMSQHSRVSSSLSEFVFLLSCKTCWCCSSSFSIALLRRRSYQSCMQYNLVFIIGIDYAVFVMLSFSRYQRKARCLFLVWNQNVFSSTFLKRKATSPTPWMQVNHFLCILLQKDIE